jgi:carbon monoxide dehydrogenase subunit G
MRISGTHQLPAARRDVWAKLNDAEVLKRCIPGCEALERISETEFQGRFAFGPLAAHGSVTLTDVTPPASYRVSAIGNGSAAGRVSGDADVRLEESAGGTRLTYDVETKSSGPVALFAQRIIHSAAERLADSFFANLAREVEHRA